MAHKAMQGSPYFESPTAMHRLKPRPMAGDLATVMGVVKKRKAGALAEKDVGLTGKKRKTDAAVESTMKVKKVKMEAEADD
jgi:hypothetical protein